MKISKAEVEAQRELWSSVAKKHGWYCDNLFIQIWVNKKGSIVDSLSVRGLDKDYVLEYETDREIREFELV